MGARVEGSSNAATTTPAGDEAIYCASCGDGDQGYAPVEYAENNWIDVEGALCCSVLCAARQSGMSEADADLARGIAADGGDSDREDTPFAAPLGAALDEDTHEHDQTAEGGDAPGDVDRKFNSIIEVLSNEEVEQRMEEESNEEGGEQ